VLGSSRASAHSLGVPKTTMASSTLERPLAIARAGTGPNAGLPYLPTIVDLSLGVPRPWPRGWHILLSGVVFALHVYYADPYYGLTADICAGLDAAIVVLLVTRYIQLRPPRLHWLEYPFALHYAEFGLPILGPPAAVGAYPLHGVPRTDSFDLGALVAFFSGVGLILGFAAIRWAARSFPGHLLFPTLEPEALSRASVWYVPMAAAFVMLNVLVPSMNDALLPVLAIIQQFFFHSQLLVVATAAYLACQNRWTSLMLGVALATVGALLVITSGISKLVIPFLGVLVLWWRGRERLPVVTIAIVVAVVKKYYREIRGTDPSYGSVSEAWQEAFSRRNAMARSAFANQEEDTANATLSRLSQLSETAHVVEMVPTKIPFGDGMIYPKMVAGLVPRILWPEKPNMTEYALDAVVIQLGLLSSSESGGTVCGISLPAQGYFEHGAAGSIAWMVLFGAMLGFASRVYPPTLAGVIAGAAATANLGLAQEGGFYNVFGAAWQLVLGSILLTWFLWVFGGSRRPSAIGPAVRQN